MPLWQVTSSFTLIFWICDIPSLIQGFLNGFRRVNYSRVNFNQVLRNLVPYGRPKPPHKLFCLFFLRRHEGVANLERLVNLTSYWATIILPCIKLMNSILNALFAVLVKYWSRKAFLNGSNFLANLDVVACFIQYHKKIIRQSYSLIIQS